MSESKAPQSDEQPVDVETVEEGTSDENETDEASQVKAFAIDDVSLDDISMPDQELEKLRAELKEADQRCLRTQAELENYRKRARREIDDERRFAGLPLMRDLLTVVDNLERAMEAAEKSDNTDGLLEGVKMVAVQLTGVLQQHNCDRIEAVGQPFDPNLHEAIGQQPSDDQPAGTVMQQMQVGYQLHDRVIRPAQVFVSTGPSTEAANETTDEPQETNQ